MQQCRVLPPSSNVFSVGLGQFPGDNGLVAPGMSCAYDIRFTPYSLRNYDDFITIQTQATYPLIVPLKARRPPPVLTIPNEVDVGSCLIGGMTSVQILVKNEGGQGRFCLMTRNKWPTANIRSVLPHVMKTSIKQAPFEIHPAFFELNSGQSVALEVIFSPMTEKTFIQEMTIICDNCQASHFKIKGDGEIPRVSLVDVELGLSEPLLGEFVDVSTKNCVRFEDLNPFTYTERIAKVKNCTKAELNYHWMVYKPVATSCYSNDQPCNVPQEERMPDLQSAFSVYPSTGVLKPSDTAEFTLTFAPSSEGNFHSVVHMLLQNVPILKSRMSVCGRRFTTYDTEALLEDENYSILDAVGVSVPFKEITALGLDLKGKCVPLNVVLHPYAIIIQAPVLRGSTIKKLFTMANHSYATISFRWESFTETYIIQVEPPFGELDPGMAIDFEINITGVQPGKISHTVLCHIMHMNEPLRFLVEAEFMGPELKVDEPSIYFGLIRIGDSESREMTIINKSETIVKFTVRECPDADAFDDGKESGDLIFSETSGALQPFGRKTIILTLTPKRAQSFKRMCLVEYEGGQPCSVGIYAEAQNPVVCFLECQRHLSTVYLNVPHVFTVILHNQTLLPTTFKWGKPEGTQIDDCVVEFLEEEGTILSWQEKVLSISFTPLKPVSFSDVRLPCHIAGQEKDIYININCDVQTLAVTYKVSTDGQQFEDSRILRFGDTVKIFETAKAYIQVCNETAIAAPYSVTMGHFVAAVVPPPVNTSNNKTASRQHALLKKTSNFGDTLTKTTAKIHKDHNKQILSNKAGAAFVVHPSTGVLLPFDTQIFEITAYNDLWGQYHDKLIFKVGDLQPTKIELELNVVGCPLSFQLTAGVPGQDAILRFGNYIAGSSPVTRKLKINNSSHSDIRVDWQVYKKDTVSDQLLDFVTYYGRAFPLRDIFGTEIVDPSAQSLFSNPESSGGVKFSESMTTLSSSNERINIVFTCLRPHNGVVINSPFSMKPSQMVVPGLGSSIVDFTFTPLSVTNQSEEIDFFGFAQGFLSLDNENESSDKVMRPEAYNADQLTVEYSAHLRPAWLTVEELGDDGLNFMAAMSDIMKISETVQDFQIQEQFFHISSIKMTNNTLTPLTFNMKVQEPFLLVELDPSHNQEASDRAMETLFCTLKPRHFLVSKVAFCVSLSLLPEILSQSGEIELGGKLTFENFLTITFVNGIRQTIPLHATLTIPQLELSDEFLDFGVCFVGQTRELQFEISNLTTSHSFWRVAIENKSDTCDDDTFKVQPEKGMLHAQISHATNSKVTVKVLFTAKHSDAYDCVLVVRGVLGEHSRQIVVIGQGSFDGRHEAILNV